MWFIILATIIDSKTIYQNNRFFLRLPSCVWPYFVTYNDLLIRIVLASFTMHSLFYNQELYTVLL